MVFEVILVSTDDLLVTPDLKYSVVALDECLASQVSVCFLPELHRPCQMCSMVFMMLSVEK